MPPQNYGPLKHVARCSPQVGKVASYFEGTVTLTGRVERADTHTYGQTQVFVPDAKSRELLPEPRQGPVLWFANKQRAQNAFRAPPLDSRNDCWTAPAKIEVSGLTTDLGDHDGNHDWVVLQNVIEVGKFTNYGCEYK
jgi:hypothetical protein